MQIRPTSNIQKTSAVNIQAQSKTRAADANPVPVDQLDISPEAQMMSAAATGSEIRMDRVADIRAQIASGQYESVEKLDAAVGRMFSEFA